MTDLEYGLEESAPVTVIVLTVVVLQGLVIVKVISTLSFESVGLKVVDPVLPLDAIVTVF